MRGKSKITITVKGLNQERAFTKLSKEVCILRLERTDSKTSTLDVKPKDFKKVKKFLRNNNFEILSAKNQGLSRFFSSFFSSYGIIAAIVLCGALYFAQYSFIWQIKVFGNENIEASEICQCIERDMPRSKNRIDTGEIELRLKEQFERISSVSVAIVGQSLVVNINEKVLPEEVTGSFQPIVSQFDGLITGITLISGTLMVEEGDIVRKGQMLVQPFVIDTDGQTRKVKAEAQIFADVWLTGQSTHVREKLVTSRTGRTVKSSEVQLFGITIYSHASGRTFEEYEVEEKTQNLIHGNLLPLKLKTKTLYETQTKLVISDFENEKENVIAAAREKALISLQDCEIIKEENSSIEVLGQTTKVSYTITVNRQIGGADASAVY